jgi:NADPH:quinone reductase
MSRPARAVWVRSFGPSPRVEIDEIIECDPGPGQVKVRVYSAGVSFADVLVATGQYQITPQLPFVPGSEFAGIIEAVGEGVETDRIGERVMASAFGGAFAEVAIVAAKSAVPMMDEMNFDEAAVFKVSYATAYYALAQRGKLQRGETLLVLGAGGAVGYAAVEIGTALGAFVIGSVSRERRALAEAGGAASTVNSRSASWREDLKTAVDGRPIDVVFDPVGDHATELAFRSLGWNGRHLVVGFAGGSIPKVPTNLALLKGASLIGVDVRRFGEVEPDAAAANLRAVLDMYKAGKLHPPVAKRYPIEEFASAMDEVGGGSTVGRIVLSMRQE